MHAPYRIASPPLPVRTEEADSYEAKLLAGRKRYRAQMALLVTGAVVLTSLVVRVAHMTPTGAERAHHQETLRLLDAQRTVHDARSRLDLAEASFDAEVRAAMKSRLSPAIPLVPCPIAIGDPEHLVRGHSMIPLLVVREGSKAPRFYSPSLERARQDVSTAASLLAGVNPMSAAVYTDALEASPIDQRLTRDVVVVVSRWKPPSRASLSAFEPGEVDGMAYVFDHTTRRVACAGELHASSSKSLTYSYNATYDVRDARLERTLAEDLERQIARAVAEPGALFVTAPH